MSGEGYSEASNGLSLSECQSVNQSICQSVHQSVKSGEAELSRIVGFEYCKNMVQVPANRSRLHYCTLLYQYLLALPSNNPAVHVSLYGDGTPPSMRRNRSNVARTAAASAQNEYVASAVKMFKQLRFSLAGFHRRLHVTLLGNSRPSVVSVKTTKSRGWQLSDCQRPRMAGTATRNSIAVAVRIRPPTPKEAALLQPQSGGHGYGHGLAFTGDGALSVARFGASTSSVGFSSASGLRRIIRAVDDRVLVFDPADSHPLVATSRQVLGPACVPLAHMYRHLSTPTDESPSVQSQEGQRHPVLLRPCL